MPLAADGWARAGKGDLRTAPPRAPLATPPHHHQSKRGNCAANSGPRRPLQMCQFGGLGQASLRRVVGGEICVGGMRVAWSMVVVARNLRGTTVVHAGRRWVREVTQIEDRPGRGRHGVDEVASHIHWAALQVGAGKAAAVARHRVGLELGRRVALLLWQAAAERRRVGGQAIHVGLRFGESGRGGCIVGQARHRRQLARVCHMAGCALGTGRLASAGCPWPSGPSCTSCACSGTRS